MTNADLVKMYLKYWYDAANIQSTMNLSLDDTYDFYVNKAEPNRLYPDILASSINIAGPSKAQAAFTEVGNYNQGLLPNATVFGQALFNQVDPTSIKNFVSNVGDAIAYAGRAGYETITSYGFPALKILYFAGLAGLLYWIYRQAKAAPVLEKQDIKDAGSTIMTAIKQARTNPKRRKRKK
jgi:hypothetical protein